MSRSRCCLAAEISGLRWVCRAHWRHVANTTERSAAMRPYVKLIFACHQLNDCGAVVQAETALCECGWQNAVADRLCDGDSSRLNTERCTVPCPGDCLLSDWSAWSSCSQTCSSPRTAAAASAGYRTRFRQVLAVQTDPGNANLRHGTIRRDMLRCETVSRFNLGHGTRKKNRKGNWKN